MIRRDQRYVKRELRSEQRKERQKEKDMRLEKYGRELDDKEEVRF